MAPPLRPLGQHYRWRLLCSLLFLATFWALTSKLWPALFRQPPLLVRSRLRPRPLAPPPSITPGVPLLIDLHYASHMYNCLGDAFYKLEAQPAADTRTPLVVLPYAGWSDAICAAKPSACVCWSTSLTLPYSSSNCTLAVPAAIFADVPECLRLGRPARALNCAESPPCAVSESFLDAPYAAGVMLYHISLSRPWLQDVGLRNKFLKPSERYIQKQTWGLTAKWESLISYPAGEDEEVLASFDISIGSNRRKHAVFSLSYLPNWELILRPYSLAAKTTRRLLPALSNITLIQSNCNSASGREDYLRKLLQVIDVDSFGSCLKNRHADTVSSEKIGFDRGIEIKHDLVAGYKFLLVFENSYEYGELRLAKKE